jgi:hypothetical protein
MMQPKDEKTIHSSPTFTARAAMAARLDAESRSEEAANENPDFFLSTDHQRRVNEVHAIVTGFLTNRKGVYINHRQNRTRPFTVVKMDGVRWPAKATRTQATMDFYEPLEKLGVKPVFSAHTNSYLFRIY